MLDFIRYQWYIRGASYLAERDEVNRQPGETPKRTGIPIPLYAEIWVSMRRMQGSEARVRLKQWTSDAMGVDTPNSSETQRWQKYIDIANYVMLRIPNNTSSWSVATRRQTPDVAAWSKVRKALSTFSAGYVDRPALTDVVRTIVS